VGKNGARALILRQGRSQETPGSSGQKSFHGFLEPIGILSSKIWSQDITSETSSDWEKIKKRQKKMGMLRRRSKGDVGRRRRKYNVAACAGQG